MKDAERIRHGRCKRAGGPGGPICCGQINGGFSEWENSPALPLRGTADSSINQDQDEPAGLAVTSQQWHKPSSSSSSSSYSSSSSHCISIRGWRCQLAAASVPLLSLSMFSQLSSKNNWKKWHRRGRGIIYELPLMTPINKHLFSELVSHRVTSWLQLHSNVWNNWV